MAERFDSGVYAHRLQRAADLTRRAGLDAVVVGTGPDFRYLTGSRADTFERLTALVVPAEGVPAVVTARLELASLRDSAVPNLGVEVVDWVDGTDPYALVADRFGGRAVAVGDSLPALHAIPLAERIGVMPSLATPVLRELRMIKDEAELAALAQAGAAIDRVHARMGEFLRPGRTEREAGADIAAAIVAEGHESAAFVIVGSGANGADPHHEVSDKVIEAGDIVVIDIGGPMGVGYNSDSTRTYCFAPPSTEIADAYAVLQAAQRASVAAVAPGVTAESVDEAGRAVLREAGLADYFIHRTGHGIGLSVHEEPYIVAGDRTILREGMTFSVEPGIYLPGRWGARIEDIVAVTTDGCRSFNNRPHELVEL